MREMQRPHRRRDGCTARHLFGARFTLSIPSHLIGKVSSLLQVPRDSDMQQ